MSEKPAIQTTSVTEPIDISLTEKAEFVYVKNHEPQHGLCPKFEGPFRIVSRPSRSQVQVKVGTYANGTDRLQVFHRSACKVAHMRDDAVEASRPQLGRKRAQPVEPQPEVPDSPSVSNNNKMSADGRASTSRPKQTNQPAKIQTEFSNEELFSAARRNPSRSTRNPAPYYVESIVNTSSKC